MAFLFSFLLHGGLGAFLWSLHGGREVSLRVVEVFSVSESAPGMAAREAVIGQPAHRSAPRPVASPPSVPVARTAIPLTIPLLPAFPEPLPTSEHVPIPEPSSETPLAFAPVLGAKEEDVKLGPGLRGGKNETVTDGVSTTGISGPLIPPRGGYQIPPTYPEAARRMGVEGATFLKVRIREDGLVGEVLVTRSAGHALLDQAAVEAVRRWRFEPARRGAEPVAVWVSLPIRFRLE